MVTTSVKRTARSVRWRQSAGGDAVRSTDKIHRTPFQRQFTPYRRTPGSRRLELSAHRPTRGRPDEPPVDLSDLVGKTWRVYKATPLYAFSYEPVALRRYSRQLGAYIQAEMSKGTVIDASEHPDVAEIKVYDGLNVSHQDQKAIQITLKTRANKDGVRIPVAVAVFLSVDMDKDISDTVNTAFTPLPIAIIRGPLTLARLLTQWMEVQFDSSISEMVIPSINLHWMVALWAGDVPEKRPKPVELCYTPPPEVDALTRVTMSIDPNDCKLLWDSIHSGGDHFMETEVASFVKALEAHFYAHFKIHLSAMHLQRVGTALACVSSYGKLKIYSSQHVLKILASLTELASEQVLTL